MLDTKNATPEQYMKLCKKLASKYKSPWWQDDLVSEGLVAIYSELAKNPNSKRVGQVAKDAMWEFSNLRNKPVTVPSGRTPKAVMFKDEEWLKDHSDYTEDNISWLKLVLETSHESIGDRDIQINSSEDKIVEDNLVETIHKVARETLSGGERSVFFLHHVHELAPAKISKMSGINKQTISFLLRSAEHKIKVRMKSMV